MCERRKKEKQALPKAGRIEVRDREERESSVVETKIGEVK
jgi:hypothetical protein